MRIVFDLVEQLERRSDLEREKVWEGEEYSTFQREVHWVALVEMTEGVAVVGCIDQREGEELETVVVVVVVHQGCKEESQVELQDLILFLESEGLRKRKEVDE